MPKKLKILYILQHSSFDYIRSLNVGVPIAESYNA